MQYSATIWHRITKDAEFEPVHNFTVEAEDWSTAQHMARSEGERKGFPPSFHFTHILIQEEYSTFVPVN